MEAEAKEFKLFGTEDTKEESILHKLESNDWTKFLNEELVHLIDKTRDDYVRIKIPVQHNNAIFRSFLQNIKENEGALLNGMQTEALLQWFGRKILYGHLKQSTLSETLLTSRDVAAHFHTVNLAPGIDCEFLDTINLARSKIDLIVRLIPMEGAFNFSLSDLLNMDPNKLILIDYLFAFDYIFYKDHRYTEKAIVSNFDTYYKQFVRDLIKRIYSKNNIIWLVNKFPVMLANTEAWDNSTGKFDKYSKDDIPNIKIMKNTLHRSAIVIKDNIKNRSLVVDPYIIFILKAYTDLYNSTFFRDFDI